MITEHAEYPDKLLLTLNLVQKKKDGFVGNIRAMQ